MKKPQKKQTKITFDKTKLYQKFLNCFYETCFNMIFKYIAIACTHAYIHI